MRVAIVHEWLITFAGSERVVKELINLYPNADLFVSLYDKKVLGHYPGTRVTATCLQRFWERGVSHQLLLPLMPRAFAKLDLSAYDLVIASSHACAKGVYPRKDARFIVYCHTPMRYVWSHRQEYLANIHHLFKRQLASWLLRRLEAWDYDSAQRVGDFVANSEEVRTRIKQYYGRESVVIHPPVSLPSYNQDFSLKSDYYLSLGRLVPYKRVDLAIAAFNRLGKRLVIAGAGEDEPRLRELAGTTVEFVGEVDEAEKSRWLAKARALIVCGEEDFGIVTVEALAHGTPVVGYQRGGITDIITHGKNGVLFSSQTVEAVMEAVHDFEGLNFPSTELAASARTFSVSAFRGKWQQWINSSVKQ